MALGPTIPPSPPAAQGQPPIGTSPATQATPNAGLEAAGAQMVGVIVNAMGKAIGLVGASSEPGMALADCIKKLGKFVPPGAVTPAAERNTLDGMRQARMQAGPQIAAATGQPPAAPPQAGA